MYVNSTAKSDTRVNEAKLLGKVLGDYRGSVLEYKRIEWTTRLHRPQPYIEPLDDDLLAEAYY